MNAKTFLNPLKDKQEDNQQKVKNSFGRGLSMAIAVALGATLGILFAPKEGAETQKDIWEKAQQLAKNFNKNREDVQETIKNIFGEVSEELEKSYLEIQGDIFAQIDEIKDKADFTEKKYHEIVAHTIKEFSKGKKWSQATIERLQENFGEAWKDVKASLSEKTEEAKKNIEKLDHKTDKKEKSHEEKAIKES